MHFFFFFGGVNHVPLNLPPLYWGKEMKWIPRAAIAVLGWEWVGAWLLPHDRADNLLGYGFLPCIDYPNGLQLSQQPHRGGRWNHPQKSSLYPFERNIAPPTLTGPPLCIRHWGKNVAKSSAFFENKRLSSWVNIHLQIQPCPSDTRAHGWFQINLYKLLWRQRRLGALSTSS